MCKNIFTNENEFDLNGPITKDGVHTIDNNPDDLYGHNWSIIYNLLHNF